MNHYGSKRAFLATCCVYKSKALAVTLWQYPFIGLTKFQDILVLEAFVQPKCNTLKKKRKNIFQMFLK